MDNSKMNIMEYLPNMEILDSSIMNEVMSAYDEYDYNSYTASDVIKALSHERISIADYAALLSPAAAPFLEQMAKRAKVETNEHFGNTVGVYTPLYIANFCENHCVYCGFNCKNKIHRTALTLAEVDNELKTIASDGYKEILILTGESRARSSLEYVGESLRIARKYFSTVGIEIYPVNSDEYEYFHDCGADYVSVYQETYNKTTYSEQHLSGSKRVFPYRFDSQERALKGGMRGVCFGALLGLDDFRKDAFAVGMQATLIQRKYPHAEISFSTPRMRPCVGYEDNNAKDVHETQLLQVMLAYRILMPFAGINISTRENAKFRAGVVGLCATKISAGSQVGVGGHDGDSKSENQFELADESTLEEVDAMLRKKGMQPIFTDSSYL